MEAINEYIVQPVQQNWEFMLFWYGVVCPPVMWLLWKWVHRNQPEDLQPLFDLEDQTADLPDAE